MNGNQNITNLIRQIEQLQLTISNAQAELENIRGQVGAIREGNTEERPLEVGERVRITNLVRLRGSVRTVRNLQGNIIRFTERYVIVNVEIPRRNTNSVQTYQEIRRASQNIERVR